MKRQNIHIVFGRAKKTLIDSNEIDLSKNQIISIYDSLNIGPVCDIQENENIQKRKDWLQDIFGDISYFNQISDYVDNDLDSIVSIIRESNKIDKVFLWTGFSASEIISTARLISHLSKLDKNIFVVGYPNIPVKSIHGDTIFPKALVQTATSQVREIVKHFKLVDKNGLSDWIKLWDNQKLVNGQLRILERNRQIVVKKVDYFDSILLSNCNENFQKAARVIGETLVDIDFAVGDSYLNWRLKQLAMEGILETQGKLIEIRDYEVRKITPHNN